MPIEIVAPRQNWAENFATLKVALLGVAPAGASIHHIGSTAVAGLPAKDIIDVQVTVDDLTAVDVEAFRSAGLELGRYATDHCPPGLELDEAELAKLFFKGTVRPAHVHVRERGRFNTRFALLCRDYLRSHIVSAGAYALIKQRLAARFPDDADAYYDIKDPVFDIIVDGAEDWARLVHWSESQAD